LEIEINDYPDFDSAMSTTMIYGLILALVNICLSLIGYFLGYQTDKIAQGQWFNYLVYLSILLVVCVGIRAVREEASDKSLSYGRGIGSGVLISLYAGILAAIYGFIHFKWINPNFTDYLIEYVRSIQSAKGASDAQLDQMEKGMRFMYGPVVLTILTPFFYVFIGLVVSLVASAFLKRNPPEGSEVAA
jgi:tetrahydromethanopterin S-methyltransferase subunit C